MQSLQERYGANASDDDSSEDEDWEDKTGTKDITESVQENDDGVTPEIKQGNANSRGLACLKKNSVRP